MGRKVLVVTTVVADEERLRKQLHQHGADVLIVAPAAKLSWLDWLTNDEDRARAEAREAADRAAEAVEHEASVQIARWSHDSDVAQAVEDALRNFSADEIVVLTRPGDDAGWLEEESLRASFDNSGVPVRHVELPDQHD